VTCSNNSKPPQIPLNPHASYVQPHEAKRVAYHFGGPHPLSFSNYRRLQRCRGPAALSFEWNGRKYYEDVYGSLWRRISSAQKLTQPLDRQSRSQIAGSARGVEKLRLNVEGHDGECNGGKEVFMASGHTPIVKEGLCRGFEKGRVETKNASKLLPQSRCFSSNLGNLVGSKLMRSATGERQSRF
jgi:hypothetical protein